MTIDEAIAFLEFNEPDYRNDTYFEAVNILREFVIEIRKVQPLDISKDFPCKK